MKVFQYIYPATLGTADAASAIVKNAQLQTQTLRGASFVLAERIKDGRLAVEPALYNLGTGKVTMLERIKM